MATSTIKYGTPATLSITINNLDQVGKTFNDITDVIFMFKRNAKDADSSALLLKKKSTGGITLVDNKIVVAIDTNDFSNTKVAANHTYLIALGVEFNNSGIFLEDEDNGLTRKIKVLQDKVRL